MRKARRLSPKAYIEGITSEDRYILSQAISVIESNRKEDNELSEEILAGIQNHTGNAIRVGITGVPGVGKSTFIETFGQEVIRNGHKLAVLTIDPSSQLSKGSILGDKTRMEELAMNPSAYIRPTASGKSLGGVASKTREVMLLCEAAGYDVVFIETVGVGQSETSVHGMVDFFLLLMLAGAGDELQGIKKGIMEMADAIAITKADGDNIQRAERAKAEYQNALHLFPMAQGGWIPKVKTTSALKKTGMTEVWHIITDYRQKMIANGFWHHQRRAQNIDWMHSVIKDYLLKEFYDTVTIKKMLVQMEEQVATEKIPATNAAKKLLSHFNDRNS